MSDFSHTARGMGTSERGLPVWVALAVASVILMRLNFGAALATVVRVLVGALAVMSLPCFANRAHTRFVEV